MNRRTKYLLAALMVASACDAGNPVIPPIDLKPVMVAVTVTGSLDSLTVENTTNLRCTEKYNKGPDEDCTAKAVWTSSNPSVASVTSGVVTAISPGSVVVTASSGGKSATVSLGVKPKPDVLVGVAIIGDSTQERAGSYQYRCLGKYSDGTEKEVVCSWEYYSPNGSSHLPGGVDSLGVVTLNAIGVASIMAIFEGHQGSLSVRLTGTPGSDIDPMSKAVWDIVKLANNPYRGVQHLDISKPITYWVGAGVSVQFVQDGLVYWIEELQSLGVQFVQVTDSTQAIAPIYRDPTVPEGYCALTSPTSGIGIFTRSENSCDQPLVIAHEWGHMFSLPHFGGPGLDIMSPGPVWVHNPIRQEALRRILGIPNGTIIVGTPTLVG